MRRAGRRVVRLRPRGRVLGADVAQCDSSTAVKRYLTLLLVVLLLPSRPRLRACCTAFVMRVWSRSTASTCAGRRHRGSLTSASAQRIAAPHRSTCRCTARRGAAAPRRAGHGRRITGSSAASTAATIELHLLVLVDVCELAFAVGRHAQHARQISLDAVEEWYAGLVERERHVAAAGGVRHDALRRPVNIRHLLLRAASAWRRPRRAASTWRATTDAMRCARAASVSADFVRPSTRRRTARRVLPPGQDTHEKRDTALREYERLAAAKI